MYTALRTLGLAAAYFLVGKLALLLAIPPGYATATWPAAGIALAGVLHWGYRVWPGIALGSFLVNVWTSFDNARPFESVALTASIAAGAALQAIVGAWLVRRSLGFPTALNDWKGIGKFLFLGGPVSCLVSATAGVGSLILWGSVPRSGFAFSWLTWWVGDTTGVLIATPLLSLWMAEPRESWMRRRISVAMPLISALALSIVFLMLTNTAEERRIGANSTGARRRWPTRSMRGSAATLKSWRDFNGSSTISPAWTRVGFGNSQSGNLRVIPRCKRSSGRPASGVPHGKRSRQASGGPVQPLRSSRQAPQGSSYALPRVPSTCLSTTSSPTARTEGH